MNKPGIIQVIEKATGMKILIKETRFNPALHQYVGQVLEEKPPEPVDLSQVIPSLQVAEVALEGEERYKELKKLRAWVKPDLKEEFYKLQAIFEPEKVKKVLSDTRVVIDTTGDDTRMVTDNTADAQITV